MLRGASWVGSVALLLALGCSSTPDERPSGPALADAGEPVERPERSARDARRGPGAEVPEDPAVVFERARQVAERGDPVAQDLVGVHFLRGDGVEPDYAQARRWFEAASAQGYGEATNHLGELHERGIGVEPDDARAAELYEQAAEQGSAHAMLNLGKLLAEGAPGVEVDLVEAYKWLDLARFNSKPSRDRAFRSECRRQLEQLAARLSEDQIGTARALGEAWMKEQLRVAPN